MKGKIPCDCSQTITEDELNTNNNDEIFAPMPYDGKWTNIILSVKYFLIKICRARCARDLQRN
jgi:hypothetical protein